MQNQLVRGSAKQIFSNDLPGYKCILILAFVMVALLAEGQIAPSGPPKAGPPPLTEEIHGTKLTDNYRWLEDGNSAETQKWVAAETAYTRSVLDPLAGREAIHKRLTELLSIGDLGVPKIAGRFYFYTRRDGMQ